MGSLFNDNKSGSWATRKSVPVIGKARTEPSELKMRGHFFEENSKNLYI